MADFAVVAPGPSLIASDLDIVRAAGWKIIAVGDAYKLAPDAVLIWHNDAAWWDFHGHKLPPVSRCARWSTHGSTKTHDNKDIHRKRWSLRTIEGRQSEGWSRSPDHIHYGSNSGFACLNFLMVTYPAPLKLVLLGYDMRNGPGGVAHFDGNHPKELRHNPRYAAFCDHYERASRRMPAGVTIINATPGSALKCWPAMRLSDALAGH